jgi:hypothetical protein
MSAEIQSSDDSDKSPQISIKNKSVIDAATEGLRGAILEHAKLITSKGNVVTKEGAVVSAKESDSSLATNILADPEVAAYYFSVYEKAQYECRHLFDPELTWTKEEERTILRKLDWRGG